MDQKQETQIKNNFIERLRSIRTGKGQSQETLAHQCELDRTYIGGVEQGERNISLLNIYRIAIALVISPRELLK